MNAETIYYTLGSVFFLLIIFILLTIAFYLIRILQIISKTASEFNSAVSTIKEKFFGIHAVLLSLAALIEKFIIFRQDKKEKKKNNKKQEKDDEEDEDRGREDNEASKEEPEDRKKGRLVKISIEKK